MGWTDFVQGQPEQGPSKDPVIQLTPRGAPGFQSRYPLIQRSDLGTPGRTMRLSEFLRDWATHPEADKKKLQDRLVAAGLLKKGSFLYGRFDEETRSALMTVISESVDEERDLETSLNDRIRQFEESGKTKEGEGYTALGGADLRTSIADAFTKELGRAPTDDELEKYERIYRSLESRAGTAEDGAVVESPGNPGALVSEQIEMTPEANAVRVREGIDWFIEKMGAA